MGVSDEAVKWAIGFWFGHRDRDQRAVTLAMRSRLHGLLGLSVDQMLVEDRAAKAMSEYNAEDCSIGDADVDSQTLLAVLVSGDGIAVDILLTATGWSSAELDLSVAFLRSHSPIPRWRSSVPTKCCT